MQITLPDLSLVVLVGPAGSGKSTFARRHFKPTEILSMDEIRAMVADGEDHPAAHDDAFAAASYLAMRRLAAGRLTVIDGRHLNPEARRMLVGLATEHHVVPVAIVFNFAEQVLHARNRTRDDGPLMTEEVHRQFMALRATAAGFGDEGFRHVYELLAPHECEAVEVRRQVLWNKRTDDHGPFDIIGDIHGCYDELRILLQKLGYLIYRDGEAALSRHQIEHPLGRKLVFLGDLAGYGPRIVETLRLVMDAVDSGIALALPGDHDEHLVDWLRGDLDESRTCVAASASQMRDMPERFRQEVEGFLSSTVSHYMLDGGRLAVAHAGIREELQGRGSIHVRNFALHGEGGSATPDWPNHYHGAAMVVYGHTPVSEAVWRGRTICVDTGCVFGGRLSAMRYPEREIISADALRKYAEREVPAQLAPPEEPVAVLTEP